MVHALRRRFGTIRWKLAGSYVLVALLITLLGELLLVGGVVFLLNTRIIPNVFADRAARYALAMQPDFTLAHGRDAGIAERLNSLMQAETQQPQVSENNTDPTPQITFGNGSSDVYTVVVDDQGRVIAAVPPNSHPVGASLAAIESPQVYAFADRALRGETETADLAGWAEPGHQLVAVAPVLGDDGRVLGLVFSRSDVLLTPQFFRDFALGLVAFLLPILIVSSLIGLVYGWFAGRGFSKRLRRLTEANAALAAGDLGRRVADSSPDEIGQLSRQFNATAEQLGENMRALRLLADQNARLAEQSAQLATVEERNRLARDLHDSVSQELFSLSMLAAASRRSIEKKPELAAQQLEEIQQMAQRALQETRSLIFALRPAALDDRGLAPAVRALAAAAQERQGLQVELSIRGERRLPLGYEQALFRIVQEALANVARHSGVRTARVALDYADDQISLTVQDHGRGFDPGTPRGARSIGLDSMAERAAALGGRLAVESAPGQGTTLTVTLPVADEVKRQSEAVTR
jgi:NarL family two-component system sensor histidine kinase LiaS